MRINAFLFPLFAIISVSLLVGCSSNQSGVKVEEEPFALGADIGWSTMQEAEGQLFYNWEGEPREANILMKEMGLNALRLRVWVDPSQHGGWCGIDDNLVKARRAKAQGLDIMVDFHYSDWWADPAKQNIPASWEGHDYPTMCQDLRQHTLDVLNAFKAEGITPKWVQVGNEISNGLLWSVERDPVTGWEIKDEKGNTTITESMGHVERNPSQYAGFIKTGEDAVREVFPEAKVIVHLDNGFDKELYRYNLDILKEGGCRWDIVGMSLYPYWARQTDSTRTDQGVIDSCFVNINLVSQRYDCDIMITEIGFLVDEDHPEVMEQGRQYLAQVIRRARTETEGRCKGVFYWEPLCNPRQYKLGAYDSQGHPTAIMHGFKEGMND